MKSNRLRLLVALLAAFTLVVAACSDDSDDGASDGTDDAATDTGDDAGTDDDGASDGTDDAATDTGDDAATDGDTTGGDGGETSALDTNGDGEVIFGIAAAGPRDDGAYYQAVVDAAIELSAENGFGDPIVVDNIQAAEAAASIGALAEQGVDVIIVGASEIAEPLPELIAEYPDVFWYCNCGAGYEADPGLAQSLDDGSEISYAGGYATGLLLQDSGGDSVVFIGCCDLGFEKEAFLAFQLGLQAVDPSFTVEYVATGDFPFDFDNTANATEALNTAVADGADAVYPYLGGAHRPIVELANEEGLITMSAGSSTVCDDSESLDYSLAIKFDGGDYVRAVLGEMIDGTFAEGDIKTFHVGVDPEPGAVICDATAEQQEAMDAVYAQIAAGEFAEEFGAIKGEAYGG